MENNIKVTQNGKELEIAIDGEIDHHTARSLRQQIDELLYYHRPKKVSLDLSSIAFMDSSGLGLILGRFTLARELGGELSVRDPSDTVKKILELAGTSRLIKIENTKMKGNAK